MRISTAALGPIPTAGWLDLCYAHGMTVHRFKVGDLVRVRVNVSRNSGEALLDAIGQNLPSGIHMITRLLPELDSGEPQYRVMDLEKQSERVVRESQLGSAMHPPQPRR